MDAQVYVAPSVHEMTKNLKWKHKHDKMVFLRLSGYTLAEIAEELDCSAGRVSVVLNSEEGQLRLREAQARLREGTMKVLQRDLELLGPAAIGNIAKTLTAKINVKDKRKVHQDKMSFELLSRIGFGKKKEMEKPSEGSSMPRDLAERLVEAVEKSAEATRIHNMPVEAEDDEPASD